MDIPIKFKFFDKLKLYQDYLKESSMLEKTKSGYWLYEKTILYWAYSKDHQHLGRPLDSDIFCKDVERVESLPKIANLLGGMDTSSINWAKDNIHNEEATVHVIANLSVLDFVKVVERYKENDTYSLLPKKVTISPSGFLLGELLYETYDDSGFWSRDFRKYKLALLIFYATFIVLLITVFLVFTNQLLQHPELWLPIGAYIWNFLGSSWWSVTTSAILIFLGLRRLWKSL